MDQQVQHQPGSRGHFILRNASHIVCSQFAHGVLSSSWGSTIKYQKILLYAALEILPSLNSHLKKGASFMHGNGRGKDFRHRNNKLSLEDKQTRHKWTWLTTRLIIEDYVPSKKFQFGSPQWERQNWQEWNLWMDSVSSTNRLNSFHSSPCCWDRGWICNQILGPWY